MNVVELHSISVVRGGKTILDTVSWDIPRGAHSVLLGANGSGKTTLLKVLTGYEWPTGGSVRVLGEEFGECDLRALRRRIGWVSSAMEQHVPRDDDAESVVASGFGATFGVYRALSNAERERCRELIAQLGLTWLGRQAFGLMSQGEQKRTLIARALAHDPPLLVLDEPCAGLDPVSRSEFLDAIGALAASPGGPTIVLVTHHVEEIRPWIARVLGLRAGKVVVQGAISEVLTSAIVADIFGRACRLVRERGEYRLELFSRD